MSFERPQAEHPEPAESREYLTLQQEPLSAAEREEDERIERERLLRNVGRETKDELSFIDFDLLETSYRKIVEKSGLDPEQTNFLRPDKILLVDRKETYGLYLQRANAILLNYERIQERGDRIGSKKLEAIGVLSHEEVHATAKSVCVGRDPYKDGAASQMGYVQSRYDQEKGMQRSFMFINEGVTEKLGREILEEYASGSGEFSQEELARFKKAGYDSHAYANNVAVVEALIDRLAFETNVQRDYVWHALIRGAYQGDQLDSEELKKLTSETLGSDLSERLRSIDSDLAKGAPYKVDELIRDLRAPLDSKEHVALPGNRKIMKPQKLSKGSRKNAGAL